MELLIATSNPGKVREYSILLADAPVTLLSLADVGLNGLDVEETGDTFQANAELKARAYAEASGKLTLADDSGLCVDALDGAPGVLSARYGGPDLSEAEQRQKLLGELAGLTGAQRAARFECVIAVADPETSKYIFAYGTCPGRIAQADSGGTEGFGYDAIFIPDGYDKTFAEFSKIVKNGISHRGVAAHKLVPQLQALAND